MNIKLNVLILFCILITSCKKTNVNDEFNIPETHIILDPSNNEIKENLDVDFQFALLEDAPKFVACKEFTYQEAKECFDVEMKKHINKYFSYPKQAKEANIEGIVKVGFIINTKGEVERVNILGIRNEGSKILEKEAIRIIKLLPKFIPGRNRGRSVDVMYAQPIVFKLN